MTDSLTLRGRRGFTLWLFGVSESPGALMAEAFAVSAPVRAGTRLKHQNRQYRLPRIKTRDFYPTTISLEAVDG